MSTSPLQSSTSELQSFIRSELLLDDSISLVEIVPDNAKGLSDSFSTLDDYCVESDDGDSPVRRRPLQQDKQRAKSDSRWEARTEAQNDKELVTPQRFMSPLKPNSSMS
jgi:hypothetical protein